MSKLINRIDLFLVISLALYSLLFLPFLGSIPFLDGNIDFVQSYDFFKGGFLEYANNNRSLHPPLKVFLSSLSFVIGGVNPFSYNLLGYFMGIVGLVAFYKFSTHLLNNKTARIATLLLSTSPMFLSAGLFSVRDYLLTILLLISLLFYFKTEYLLYSLSASLLVLTKDAGLLLPIWVLVIEIIYSLRQKLNTFKLILLSLPIFTSFSWYLLLKLNHQKPWSDWIFADTAAKGSVYTIFHNFFTLGFINQYTFQHWLHLFILNFNWVFWLLTIIGLFFAFSSSAPIKNIISQLKIGKIKTKTIILIIGFIISYLLSVLSFPTYTIPRYILPILPFMYLGAVFGFNQLVTRWPIIKIPLAVLGGFVIFLSLFFSVDPLSLTFWPKMTLFKEKIYSLNQHLAGNDGITYNMQYLLLAKKRTKQIEIARKDNFEVTIDNCHWVFPDPVNDYQTMKILKLTDDKNKIFCLDN